MKKYTTIFLAVSLLLSILEACHPKESAGEKRTFLEIADPHAPPMIRVNGALMNFTAFDHAFGVKAGDKLFVPDSARIRIW